MKLGKWITNQTAKPFYVRKQIEITKKIQQAQAMVCGLGQFTFSVNGQKVGDHELDPGWTNYNKQIQYVLFDVTEYLKKGANIIGGEVGNGWFILEQDSYYIFKFPEFMPPNPNPYRPFGKYLVFNIKLKITYEDGTKETIISDESFETREHPVRMSNVYGSEIIDGVFVQKDWTNPEMYEQDGWESAVILEAEDEPKGELTQQMQPAIKVIESYKGKFLHNVENREIYDFTQNMSGILSFEAKGKKGDIIRIYPAEKLADNGDVDQVAKDWVTVDSCITYKIGEDDVWESVRMQFTYFAGRFVAVESNKGISVKNLSAHAITSATKKNGTFTCDDKRYEQIYDLVEKAVEANMLSVHTDCPTIERFAWQEPNHLMAPSIFYMKDGKALWEKFLTDMRNDQHTKEDYFFDFVCNKVYPGDGLMPSQCPCYMPNVLPVPGMGSFYDIIPWGSTCILGTYWQYEFYGDKKIIEDNYDAGKRYLNHLKTKINEEGFINHGLGDWGNPEQILVRENIETAFLYADTVVLEKFAEILGREEDVKELHSFSRQVKENYNQKLLVEDRERGFWCYKAWDHSDEIILTQASQALPLYWGLVPEEKKSDIIKAFRYTLDEKGAFICGEVGLPYVIQTARKYGMNDLICEFILKEQHPSYYAFVLDGETTLGEYWESNPRSHCHDMMGHIIEWYYNGIAGIQPLEPGFSKVKIQPYLPESMNEFQCRYETVYGTITVDVKRTGKFLQLKLTIPESIKYEVDIANLEKNGRVVAITIDSE